MKTSSKLFLGTALLATTLLLAACSSNHKYGNLTKDEAKTEVAAYYKKIDPTKAKLKKDISSSSLDTAAELPNIDKTYPYTVDGDGKINAEIFVSSEKAGEGCSAVSRNSVFC